MQPSSSACLSLWALDPVPGLTQVWCSDFTGLVDVPPVGRAGGGTRSASQISAYPEGCGGNIWGEKRVFRLPTSPLLFVKFSMGI